MQAAYLSAIVIFPPTFSSPTSPPLRDVSSDDRPAHMHLRNVRCHPAVRFAYPQKRTAVPIARNLNEKKFIQGLKYSRTGVSISKFPVVIIRTCEPVTLSYTAGYSSRNVMLPFAWSVVITPEVNSSESHCRMSIS